jgi:hypothetical protein|tara:strand:- start:879 stop:2813 length:1935 start_codon:yes stop_codon:yes gene_type:complete
MRGIPELPELPRTPETPGYLPSAEGVQVIPDDFEIDTDVVAAEDAEAPNPESAFFENLADKMSKEDLARIGNEVVEGFKNDEDSLTEMRETEEEYNKMLDMTYEETNHPWPGAANVMVPVILKATVNFAARATLNLIGAEKVVKGLALIKEEAVEQRARRVAKYQNVQINHKMPNYRSGFSKTLTQLARDGYAFRKQYWDSEKKQVMSDYILPEDFVVNHYTKTLESSYRYTQVIYMNPNEIKLKQYNGIYIECEADLGVPSADSESTQTQESKKNKGAHTPAPDYATPRKVLECHTYVLEKEDDKVRKPFVVTVDYETSQVLRMIRREHPDTKKPIQFYTNYEFLPNDRSIFGYGFGPLLLGVNATMNSTINQLLNAGTLQTQQGGFVLKGSSIARGQQAFKMGEFKEINSRTDDVRKALMPLDFKPPSGILLQLLSFMKDFSEEFTTVTELFSGAQPKSDTTATAAQIAREEGAKMFTGIQQRIHQDFKRELQNIKTLNSIFLEDEVYLRIIRDEIPKPKEGEAPEEITAKGDFKNDFEIVPVSDPNIISDQQTIAKAEHYAKVVAENPFLAQNPKAIKRATLKRLESIGENDASLKIIEDIMDEAIEMQEAQKRIQQGDDKAQTHSDNLSNALKNVPREQR